MTFEIEISRDAFEPAGVGDAFYIEAHYSPNKIGSNVTTDITRGDPLPPPVSSVPEPLTLLTGLIGLAAVGGYVRRRSF